jgi:hypothetical protein
MKNQCIQRKNVLYIAFMVFVLGVCAAYAQDYALIDSGHSATLHGTTRVRCVHRKDASAVEALPQMTVDLYFPSGTVNEDIAPAGIEVTSGGDIWFLETAPIWPGDTSYSRLVHFYPQFPPDSSTSITPIVSYVSPDYDTAEYSDVYYALPQHLDVLPTINTVTADSSNAFARYRIPTDSNWCCDLDPNGTIFFTERQADKIGRFDPATLQFTEWVLPTSNSWPIAICASNDTVFFIECAAAKIGRLIPSVNLITEWEIPNTVLFGPGWPGLDIDENGCLWFTDRLGHYILRAELAGADSMKFDKWLLPGYIYMGPNDIMSAQDNEIWYTIGAVNPGFGGSKIGMFDPLSHVVKEWEVPTDTALAYYLEADTNGNIWFSENYGCGIAKLEAGTSTFTEYLVEMPAGTDGGCYDFAIDHEGNAWLTSVVGIIYKFPGLVYSIEEGTSHNYSFPDLCVFPNPFKSSVNVMLDGFADIHVYDVAGRYVAYISGNTWDGRNASGNVVKAGVYFLKIDGLKPFKVIKMK